MGAEHQMIHVGIAQRMSMERSEHQNRPTAHGETQNTKLTGTSTRDDDDLTFDREEVGRRIFVHVAQIERSK
jgi:hypothetical protein